MKKELKLGIFAIVVLVVSFFVLNYLKGEDIFNKESEYVSAYTDLEGLVASAPVYIKGYKAGKVSDITYDKTKGVFYVTCSVSKDFDVPSDSQMTIYSVDIMGGKGVRIDQGTSEVPASDGDTLAPCFETGLMDGLSESIVPLMSKIEKTIDSLGVTVSGVNKVLSDSNTDAFRRTLSDIESLVGHLESVSGSIDGKSEEIAALIDNLKSFSDGLGTVLSKVDTTLVGVSAVVDSLGTADMAGTINSMKGLLDKAMDPDGTVGKLFEDGSIYESVDSLLNNIDRFIDKIQENPKKYLRISVF